MKTFYFETTCVSAAAEEVAEFDATSREVSYATIAKHCAGLNEVFPDYNRSTGLHLGRDWAVSFYKGKFRGKPCYVVMWSAIHHFFVQQSQGETHEPC